MERLQVLLDKMEVPVTRKHDARWLLNNLVINNADHPELKETIDLIIRTMKKRYNSRVIL
jgi:hypothetical protein